MYVSAHFHINPKFNTTPKVHIILPPLQKLRPIVERLRPMSDFLAVRANNSGKLQLSIRTDSVTVDTEWKNCKNTNRGV
jgi:HUS1 checkpoint protein